MMQGISKEIIIALSFDFSSYFLNVAQRASNDKLKEYI